jgi:hypothetical protein
LERPLLRWRSARRCGKHHQRGEPKRPGEAGRGWLDSRSASPTGSSRATRNTTSHGPSGTRSAARMPSGRGATESSTTAMALGQSARARSKTCSRSRRRAPSASRSASCRSPSPARAEAARLPRLTCSRSARPQRRCTRQLACWTGRRRPSRDRSAGFFSNEAFTRDPDARLEHELARRREVEELAAKSRPVQVKRFEVSDE